MKKSMIRKITAILLAFSLLCPALFTGCGETPAETKDLAEAITTEAPAETDEETVLTQQTPETEETTPETAPPTETAEETAPEASDIPKTETPVTAEPTHTHKYKTVNTVPATCTAKGSVEYLCETCGDTYTKTTDMAAHSYGAFTTVAEATCAKAGKQIRTCTVCGKEETKTVAKKDHQYSVKQTDSKNVYTCSVCGYSYATKVVCQHNMERTGGENNNFHYKRCTKCDYAHVDYYAEYVGKADDNVAMNTDKVKLTKPYTGQLLQWSDKWMGYATYVKNELAFYAMAHDDLPQKIDEYCARYWEGEGDPPKDFYDDFDEFRQAFAEVYGWKPVALSYNQEKGYYYYETKDQYEAFTSQIKKLSSAEIDRIEHEMAAYYVYDAGIYEGMSVYDAVYTLYYYIANHVEYDHSYSRHKAIYGFSGGLGVCDCYTSIFDLVSEYCGINSKTVIGKARGDGHAWNSVTFSDGTVRYVDVTWNSTENYILITREKMAEDHVFSK